MDIIFDGNYLFHRNFSVFSTYYRGESMDKILSDKEKRQVLLRKCITDLCYTINRFNDVKEVACVIDSSSWRYNFYSDYKFALTRVRDSYYPLFLDCLNDFEQLLRNRGLIVSKVRGAEGDDLLYIWSVYFDICKNEELVIVTGDSDIRQVMTDNVSVFCNNSKYLKMYCTQNNEVVWNERLDTDIQVIVNNPFDVVLYKVVMGDKSDNIIKIKRGFGDKAFNEFIQYLQPYDKPINKDLATTAQWIAYHFSKFIHADENEILNKVLFNLQMTWLNLSVYNEINYENGGNSLLSSMLNDVNKQKDKYSYKYDYTLQDFYGMIIK